MQDHGERLCRVLHRVERDLETLSSCLLSAEVVSHYSSKQRQSKNLALYQRRLAHLHPLILQLMHCPSLDDLFETTVRLGREYLEIDRIAIFLVDRETNRMQGSYGTDPDGNLVDRRSFISTLPDHPLVNNALANKDYMVVKDHVPLYFGREQVGTGWNAMVSLWDDSACLGWIAADNLMSQSPFDDGLREALKLLGLALSAQMVVKRTHENLVQLNQELEMRVQSRTQALAELNEKLMKANEELASLSQLDGLTGVYNRRAFDENLAKLWRNREDTVAILLLDVDHFKAYNDASGHLCGDDCLRKIASSLNFLSENHKNVTFYRYGGEEFAFLFSKKTFQSVVKFAHEVRQTLASLSLIHPSSCSSVTVSMGGQWLSSPDKMTLETAILNADRRLYRVKLQGRDGFLWQDIE